MKSVLAVTGAFAVVTLAMTWPLAATFTSAVPGQLGDPLLAMWAIGWDWRALTRAVSDPAALTTFWDANAFSPEHGSLAFGHHFVGQAALVLPILWATDNVILAYNVLFVTAFAGYALGTFLLVRSLTGNVVAGVTGALVAAFNESRLMIHPSDLSLLSVHWLPFGLLGIHRYLLHDSASALAGGALALWWLLLSSPAVMANAAPFVVLFVMVEMVRLKRWRRPRVWLELWAGAAAVTALSLPFVFPYLDVLERLDPAAGAGALATATGIGSDHALLTFAGAVVPVALAALALVPWPKPRSLAVSFPLALLAFWLYGGSNSTADPRWFDLRWVFERAVAYSPRHILPHPSAALEPVALLWLALLSGLGAARLSVWAPHRSQAMLAVALMAHLVIVRPRALPLDQPLASPSLAETPMYLTPAASAPRLYEVVRTLPDDSVVVELPFGDPGYEARYMFFAATHGRRVANGFGPVRPASHAARMAALEDPARDRARAEAALSDVSHVVVHRGAWRDDTAVRLEAWLESIGAVIMDEVEGAGLWQLRSPERLARQRHAP